MLVRKLFSEDEILKILNEEMEEDEEEMENEEGEEESESPIEDIDLESMSDSEKLQLAYDIISSCECEANGILDSIKETIDSLLEDEED